MPVRRAPFLEQSPDKPPPSARPVDQPSDAGTALSDQADNHAESRVELFGATRIPGPRSTGLPRRRSEKKWNGYGRRLLLATG